jgi:hypothetical protein
MEKWSWNQMNTTTKQTDQLQKKIRRYCGDREKLEELQKLQR